MSLILLGILNSQAAAAGGAAAFDLLETQELSSTAASIEFTSLDSYSDYEHFHIRGTARTTWTLGGALNWMYVTMNGLAGSRYYWGSVQGDGSSSASYQGRGVDYWSVNEFIPNNNAPADSFGGFMLDFYNVHSTTKRQTIRSLHGGWGSTDKMVSSIGGSITNASAVTSLKFEPDAGNFQIGTRISIYGVR